MARSGNCPERQGSGRGESQWWSDGKKSCRPAVVSSGTLGKLRLSTGFWARIPATAGIFGVGAWVGSLHHDVSKTFDVEVRPEGACAGRKKRRKGGDFSSSSSPARICQAFFPGMARLSGVGSMLVLVGETKTLKLVVLVRLGTTPVSQEIRWKGRRKLQKSVNNCFLFSPVGVGRGSGDGAKMDGGEAPPLLPLLSFFSASSSSSFFFLLRTILSVSGGCLGSPYSDFFRRG